jgi:hypothetical protein
MGCGLFAVGCKPREEIQRYQVPKSETASKARASHPAGPDSDVAAEAASDRLLAAVVPQNDKVWTFKLAGPQDAVAPHAEAFRSLLRSLQFADGKPQWKLPEGWRAGASSIYRFATLEIESAGRKLELTVVPDDKPADDEGAIVLTSVNRWRNQMGLSKVSEEQLAKETEQLPFAGGAATVVDLTGRLSAGGRRTVPGAAPAQPGPSALKADVPAGWQPGQLTVSRGGITLRHEAAYEVVDGKRRLDITVDRLPAQPLLQNINRWRGQIKLEPIDDKQLAQQLRKLPVGELSADYVELVGPEQSILGAVLARGAEGWYVKLMGGPELTQREKQNFENFVKSFRFP